VTEKINLSPVVEVGGAPLTKEEYEELRTLRIDRTMGLVGRAILRFSDPGYVRSQAHTFKIGTKVKVKQFPSTELFSGSVVAVNLEQMRGEQPYLVVVADDDAYKLTRGTTTKTYLQTSYTSAVQQVVAKAGLKPKITSSPGVKEYILHAGSDIEFIDRVAARIGYTWWIDQGMFHFAPAGTSTGSTKVTMNDDLEEFSVRASGLRPTEIKVGGWHPDNQQKVVGTIQKGKVWTTPSDFVKPWATQAQKLGVAKAATIMPSPMDQHEAKVAAQALFDESLAASLVARGKGHVNGLIKPGVTVQVDHAGPASGKYWVTEVQHVYDTRGFHTQFVAGSLRPAGLVDTLGNPAVDPGFEIRGLVIGVVTDNHDLEKNGRVKVKYAGMPEDVESNWARVMTTGSGKNRGVVFLPEVDDEVLVGFEGSDTRRPVILGSLFSKKNILPEKTKLLGPGNKVNYRRITSRLGHIIEFADGMTPTTEHVLVQLGGSATTHKLRLGADRFDIEVAMGKPVLIKAGMAKFEITATGDVNIEGANINIKGKTAVNIESPKTTTKGLSQVQMIGGTAVVKGMGQTEVSAGGPLTIKGITVAIN
jgi:phage protein D/phage baseplate assembly protein gpV